MITIQGVTNALALWLQGTRQPNLGGEIAPGPVGASSLTLSDRQVSILNFVADGLSNSEIARALRCSRSTVKLDLQRAMAALAASNRAQAAARARELGLIDAPRPA